VSTESRPDLAVRERAALFLLLAEGRELSTAEVRELGGPDITGEVRRRLNELKLVASEKVGRGFRHEITDDGAAWCTTELGMERPARGGVMAGAFYAVLRGLARTNIPLAELFPYRGAVTGPTETTEGQIRAAYARAVASPGGWLDLARLRSELPDLERAELDSELERLAATEGVHLEGESNQKALTDADRAAAVRFGGDDRHMIMIEAG